MKLVVFTLDSIFALILAVTSIAMLSYFVYLPQTTTTLSYSSSAATLQNLLASNISSVASSGALLFNLTYQSNASNEAWDQFLNNPSLNGGNIHGPRSPNVAFITTLPYSSYVSRAVVDYGRMFFIVGSTLYSINATNGNVIWSKNIVGNLALSPIIAGGKLIYANRTNLTAINPITNSIIWSTNSVAAFAQPIAYNNKVYDVQGLPQTNIISAYYLNNGTQAWTYTIPTGGANGAYLAMQSGSLAFAISGASSTVGLLEDFGNSANIIWNSVLSQSVYGLSASTSGNNIIAYISGSSANAVNVDGTLAAGFPYSISSQAYNYPTIYNNVVYYQSSNAITAVGTNGVALWTYTAPSAYGTAVVGDQPGKSSMPVVSSRDVYATWSNGYLVALNVTSGQTDFATKVPNGSFYVDAVAYGRLYTILSTGANVQVIAYGACGASISAGSALQQAATLYANGQGSCADSLVNSFLPMSNYSIFLNNTFAPAINIATFSGTNSYVINTYKAPLNNLQTFTITAWVNPSSSCATSPNIYSEGVPTVTFQFALVNAGCNLYLATWNQNTPGNWKSFTYGSSNVPQNKWTFVAAELSVAGTGAFIVYQNANPLSSAGQAESNPSASQSGIGFNIGSLAGQANQYFNGKIANLQIYNSTLTPTQISQIYSRGIQGSALQNAGLQGWYPLAGDTNDYSGFGNTAYPSNLLYQSGNYLPIGYQNAYQVSKASSALPIINYTSGKSKMYKVSVVAWH